MAWFGGALMAAPPPGLAAASESVGLVRLGDGDLTGGLGWPGRPVEAPAVAVEAVHLRSRVSGRRRRGKRSLT